MLQVCVPVMMGKEVGPVCNRRRTSYTKIAYRCNIPYHYSDGVAPDVSPVVSIQAVLYVCARKLVHTRVVGVAINGLPHVPFPTGIRGEAKKGCTGWKI